MAEGHLEALFKAVRRRLVTSAVWGERVYAHVAPAGTTRPYVVFSQMAGGALNERVVDDAGVILAVKCIANEMAAALVGAEVIRGLLDDSERYDPLDGGSNWTIIHSTREQDILMAEMVNGVQVWHAGARYRFRMERV